MNSQSYFLIKDFGIAVIVMLFAFALIMGVTAYNKNAADTVATEDVSRVETKRELLELRETDFVYGSRDASIKLVLYSDHNCQYCRALYPKLKTIVDAYPNEVVSLVYRHIPIYNTRDEVDEAEIAGACVWRSSGDTGFFQFLDALYGQLPSGEQTSNISRDLLRQSAAEAGVENELLDNCITEAYGSDFIASQHSSGGALGVIVVPHTFIVSENNIYEVPRNQSTETFLTIVNSILTSN